MGVLINIGSIMGKDILNLADGTMVGKVCGVALTPDNKVAGLKVKEKKFMGNVNMVPFENVKAFGATITLNGIDGSVWGEVRDGLGKNVITADGNLLGRVEELAFDAETGDVAEIVIKGDLMDTLVGGRGILPGEKIVSFGKDVVIAAENITAEDFQVPAEEFYGDWKTMDEMLEDIDTEDGVSFDEDGFEQQSREEKMESTIDGLTRTVEETFNKLKDEVTSEKFKEQTDRFIDRFGEEAKNLFNDMRERVKNIDTEGLKEDLKSKMNRREEPEDVLAADLVAQMEDLTVAKPVLDEEGNVIVWPGQIIGKEEVKTALRSGKLQDLLDLATVSLLEDHPTAAAPQAEEAPEEVVAEKAAEEDDAFIVEEAAKMEEAEAVVDEDEDRPADDEEIEVELVFAEPEAKEAEAVEPETKSEV